MAENALKRILVHLWGASGVFVGGDQVGLSLQRNFGFVEHFLWRWEMPFEDCQICPLRRDQYSPTMYSLN